MTPDEQKPLVENLLSLPEGLAAWSRYLQQQADAVERTGRFPGHIPAALRVVAGSFAFVAGEVRRLAVGLTPKKRDGES